MTRPPVLRQELLVNAEGEDQSTEKGDRRVLWLRTVAGHGTEGVDKVLLGLLIRGLCANEYPSPTDSHQYCIARNLAKQIARCIRAVAVDSAYLNSGLKRIKSKA